MIYTADELIEAIKRNCGVPSSQRRFNDTDFLRFLNEELNLKVIGILAAMQQDYFVETETTALVSGQSTYSFPTRAIGWKVNSVGYLDSDGKYTKLPRISRSQRGRYGNYSSTSNCPTAVYVMGTKIVTFPDIGSNPTGSLQIDFIPIQNQLVKVNECGLIQSVVDNDPDWTITVNSVPLYSNGVDVVGGVNPFEVICRNATATVVGQDMTIAKSAFLADPVAGDYICEKDKTPIPNIPEDAHPLLAQAGTRRVLISINDQKGLQSANLSFNEMVEDIKMRAADRIDSSPIKLVTPSHILNLMRG